MTFALSDRAKHLESLSAALSALGLEAEAHDRERVVAYLSLLQRWNAVHNLSATRDTAGLLGQHIIDCLAIVPSLRRHAGNSALRVLDAGTGAGLPAVVLAIMNPKWSVTAVDSVAKKIAFLRHVSGELGLSNLRPCHARLEDMSATDLRFDVVTSRALGTLSQLIEHTKHLIEPAGIWAAMKGKPPEEEFSRLPPDCQLFHVEPLIVPELDAQRCLVWLRPVTTATTR